MIDVERAQRLISEGNRRELKALARQLLDELTARPQPEEPQPNVSPLVPRHLLRDDTAPHQIRLRLAAGGSQRLAVTCTCLGSRNLLEATTLPAETAQHTYRRHLADVGETTPTERTST